MGVAFVAHCLLNQNSKVRDGAHCAGVYSPIVDVLRAELSRRGITVRVAGETHAIPGHDEADQRARLESVLGHSDA